MPTDAKPLTPEEIVTDFLLAQCKGNPECPVPHDALDYLLTEVERLRSREMTEEKIELAAEKIARQVAHDTAEELAPDLAPDLVPGDYGRLKEFVASAIREATGETK